MPASRTAADGKNSTLYALVIFVVLFLAAAVFAVIFYVNNEQLARDAQNAEEDLQKVATSSELNALRPLMPKGGSGATAIKRITSEMNYLAGVIAGDAVVDAPLVGIRGEIEKILNEVYAELAQLQQSEPFSMSDPSLTHLKTSNEEGEAGGKRDNLLKVMDTLVGATKYWAGLYTDAERELATHAEVHGQELQRLQGRIEALQSDLDEASKAAQVYEGRYAKLRDDQAARYEQQIQILQKSIDGTQAEKNQAVKTTTSLNEEIAKCRTEIKDLNDRLKLFQPDPEQEATALEPDGHVVSVVPRDNIAYINLAKNDHIYRGLTFSVYDRFQPIPRTGQGKGSIEVIEIMDRVSKCRIVDHDLTNPIMKDDIIASLVWAADKKYIFCVAGDFDFNGDGQIDFDGRDRVVGLIERWGGQSSETLSVETDFLVLGKAPVVPELLEDAFGLTEAQVANRRLAEQKAQAYQQITKDAAALDVPTFNMSRFLYFVGYYKQAKAGR